ncbi:MAG: repressor LexA [Chloroflexi bacterium]|nr:repressor LexA [Chloroflexota bacterium]
MNALDEHERSILRFIERYQNKFGRSPSYEEIRQGTGMSSKDHVYRDVKALAERKYLKRERAISRGLTLLRTADGYPVTPNGYSIPILGAIAAGNPIPLPEGNSTTSDWIEITRGMIPDAEDVFAVRVRGNSMIDALVNDGDTVVMRKQESARNGELVAVRLKKDPTNVGVTLKRFFRRNGHVWLQPENPTLEAKKYNANEVEIQGQVLCVIRHIPNGKGTRPLRPR